MIDLDFLGVYNCHVLSMACKVSNLAVNFAIILLCIIRKLFVHPHELEKWWNRIRFYCTWKILDSERKKPSCFTQVFKV